MRLQKIVTTGVVLFASGWLLTACSLRPKTEVEQTILPTNTSEQIQQIETELQQPMSDSTEVEDLDQELTDFQVLEEDFSDL